MPSDPFAFEHQTGRASSEPKETRELEAILASLTRRSGDCVAIGSEDGLIFLNDAGRRLAGRSEENRPRSIFDLFWPQDREYVRRAVMSEIRRHASWSGETRIYDAGRERPIPVFAEMFAIGGADARAEIALVARDRTAAVRADARTRVLVGASATSNSLDLQQTFEAIASLVVRSFATYCVIDVVNDRDDALNVRRVATDHVDRERRRLVAELTSYTPDFTRPSQPIAAALIDGSSTLVPEVTSQWIEEITLGPEHARILRELGVRSWMTVPLVARGKILGALTCGLASEREHRTGFDDGYEAEDLFIAEELGRRAGTSIDNARLYEYQRNIAVTLQDASLPTSLPRIDHMRLSAEYRPSGDEATIGGDWYDAFELNDGRVAITIGDVQGHGLHAAVTMTKLRQAMQSAAMVEADPALMLDVADQTLGLHDHDGYATALAAIFDPADHTLEIASAGHPRPMLRLPTGSVAEIDVRGTMLGIRAGIKREVHRISLPVDSSIAFFTDGLIEATRDIEDAQRRLAHVFGTVDPDERQTATAIVDRMLANIVATDDVAVLCISIADRFARDDPPKQTSYAKNVNYDGNRRPLATAS